MAVELLQAQRPAKRTFGDVLRDIADCEAGDDPVDAVVVFALHKGEHLDCFAVHHGDFVDAVAALTIGQRDWLEGAE